MQIPPYAKSLFCGLLFLSAHFLYSTEPEPITYFDTSFNGPSNLTSGNITTYYIEITVDPRIAKERIRILHSKSLRKVSLTKTSFRSPGKIGLIRKYIFVVQAVNNNSKIIGVSASGFINKEKEHEDYFHAIYGDKGTPMDDIYNKQFVYAKEDSK